MYFFAACFRKDFICEYSVSPLVRIGFTYVLSVVALFPKGFTHMFPVADNVFEAMQEYFPLMQFAGIVYMNILYFILIILTNPFWFDSIFSTCFSLNPHSIRFNSPMPFKPFQDVSCLGSHVTGLCNDIVRSFRESNHYGLNVPKL